MKQASGWERPFFKNIPKKPEVIAHRGGLEEYPEETIKAFDHAVKLGVDVLEMDVHSTADGKLVLMHNSTVDETTNGAGKIKNLEWDYLKNLDAGFWWTNDGKNYPHRGQEIRIPLLNDVFDKFSERRIVIEIKQRKPSIVKPLADLIRKCGMTDKVLIASFYHRALKEFRAECPEVATSASTLELFKFIFITSIFSSKPQPPAFDAVQVGIRFAKIPMPFINRWTIRAARRLKIPIQAWTVNREDDMQKMIKAEVDGIITDKPKVLLELLNRI